VPVGCSVTLDDVKPLNELAYIIGIGVLVSKEELLEFRILLALEMW
jgi:hypothetical protein